MKTEFDQRARVRRKELSATMGLYIEMDIAEYLGSRQYIQAYCGDTWMGHRGDHQWLNLVPQTRHRDSTAHLEATAMFRPEYYISISLMPSRRIPTKK